MMLSDIFFDEQDASLFLVDDAYLRAAALKHSVLPRLRAVMNSAISQIREIYDVDVLDDSIVSVFPNFRQPRNFELKHQYHSAFVGLGGQRKTKWFGFSRQDGKPVQVLPFRFAFVFTQEGFFLHLENGWLKGLSNNSFELLLQFHIEYEDQISPLCFEAGMRPSIVWAEGVSFFSSFREQYQYRIQHKIFDNHFFGQNYHFPVAGTQLTELVRNFAIFFPVYDSYIQMAKGLPHRFEELLAKLHHWFRRGQVGTSDEIILDNFMLEKTKAFATASAETKIRIMPALRWQVFQRDQWKCVACGRNSHDGTILHIDHIIPRSLGGLDVLANYQTLCNICNLGKSNRDSTDLRNKG